MTTARVALHAHKHWIACPYVSPVHLLYIAAVVRRVLRRHRPAQLRRACGGVTIRHRDAKRIANALSATTRASSLSTMAINAVRCMGTCKLVAGHTGAAVGGVASLVGAAVILLALMRYRLLVIRTLML